MQSQYVKIEAQHYNQKASKIDDVLEYFENVKKYAKIGLLRKAHNTWHSIVDTTLQNSNEKSLVLDYGCGKGVHSIEKENEKTHIIGIDISEASIAIANQLKSELKSNAEYQVMNCEKTNFKENYFNVILDYGTFSSLDMKLAIVEIVRILKPNGVLIAIETYGHNPFTNIKRWLNVLLRKRTKWAASHIMRKKDWQQIASYFEEIQMQYFGFWVLWLAPFQKILPQKLFLKILTIAEKCDKMMLQKKIFSKLAFKTVVVLKNPKR